MLYSHPVLKGRLVLKGGTALNLFLFDLPRLSVDIDLNYIGAVDRATMLQEKPKLEQAVQAVCGGLVSRSNGFRESMQGESGAFLMAVHWAVRPPWNSI